MRRWSIKFWPISRNASRTNSTQSSHRWSLPILCGSLCPRLARGGPVSNFEPPFLFIIVVVMRRTFIASGISAVLLGSTHSFAQVPKKAPASSPQNAAERAVSLAESGHCTEAMPLLKKSIRQIANKDLQKRAGLDGLNCAMTHNTPSEALPFLEVLVREFPRDPGGAVRSRSRLF